MQDVVLVGGGHAHVEVIRRFGMHRLAGVRLTLITPEVLTPYSGMVPGYVSGFYTHEDCHIDLIRLARFADARLVLARAKGIDTAAREVELEGDRPNIAYDVLSLNVGITPSMEPVDGAKANCIPVKPITTFSARFEKILHEAISNDSPMRVAVVGGGAGGVELACALRYRLIKERSEAGIDEPLSIVLVSKGPILKGLASYARRAFAKLLKDRNIEVIESEGGVAAAASKRLTLSDGSSVAFDVCLWCTHAEAPRWLSYSGLRVDEQGFVLVNENLQVEGGPPEIFAVGDAATSVVHPRPKAGVYAVRAVRIPYCKFGFSNKQKTTTRLAYPLVFLLCGVCRERTWDGAFVIIDDIVLLHSRSECFLPCFFCRDDDRCYHFSCSSWYPSLSRSSSSVVLSSLILIFFFPSSPLAGILRDASCRVRHSTRTYGDSF